MDMNFWYDKDGDILYAELERTHHAVYSAVGNGIFLRKDEDTGKIVGFYILNYGSRVSHGETVTVPRFCDLRIPPLSEIIA